MQPRGSTQKNTFLPACKKMRINHFFRAPGTQEQTVKGIFYLWTVLVWYINNFFDRVLGCSWCQSQTGLICNLGVALKARSAGSGSEENSRRQVLWSCLTLKKIAICSKDCIEVRGGLQIDLSKIFCKVSFNLYNMTLLCLNLSMLFKQIRNIL